MIDCHVHTNRSHHGQNDLEDYVKLAIQKKFSIIGFSEHAPFTCDDGGRLTHDETHEYLSDLEKLKTKYVSQIKILSGLEVDFTPSAIIHLPKILEEFKCDFFAGAVHYLELPNESLTVWDYERLQDTAVQNKYFETLKLAVTSGLFTNILHPDIILRAGITNFKVLDKFLEILPLFASNKVGYEINGSGFYKPVYVPKSKDFDLFISSYPNYFLVEQAHKLGVDLTIGSDAHQLDHFNTGTDLVRSRLLGLNISDITYYENCVPKKLKLT